MTEPTTGPTTGPTTELHRLPEKQVRDRAALDALLDSQWAGVLSTVVDGAPLAVPMLYVRDGDRVLLHGSTGAGALRAVAAGASAVLTVFALDALVVAPTTFESSLNYRSATIRGELAAVDDAALEVFSEALIPGRTAEVRPSTRKELAATQALALPIAADNWLLKVSAGWPATPEEAGAEPDVWSGLVPVRTVLDRPVAAPWAADLPVPPSVRRLAASPDTSPDMSPDTPPEPPAVRVRRAGPDDAAGVARVHVASWRAGYAGMLPDELLDGLSVEERTADWTGYLTDGSGRTFVALADDDTVLGFVTVGASRDEDAAPGTGEVWALYTHPDAWRRGVGSALAEAARRELRALGFARATLWVLTANDRARRFYEHHGWQPRDRHQVDRRGDVALEEVQYELGDLGA